MCSLKNSVLPHQKAYAIFCSATNCHRRAVGLARGRVVYVESIARVYRLSLTGKILYHLRLADSFFVQWPDLRTTYPRCCYKGRVM